MVRAILILGVLLPVVALAGMLFHHAVQWDPIIEWDDYEPRSIPPALRDTSESFSHVPAFLASIPHPIGLIPTRKSARLNHAEGFLLQELRRDQWLPGALELVRAGHTVGLIGSRTVIVPVDRTRLIVYGRLESDLLISLVALDRLTPIPDVLEAGEWIGAGHGCIVFDRAAYEHVTIPRSLTAGAHDFSFPGGLAKLDEVVLLDASKVMLLEPTKHRLTVIVPADESLREIDKSHWPERLFRDPKTGRVVGDGIRLRPFVLSEDLTRVEFWLD